MNKETVRKFFWIKIQEFLGNAKDQTLKASGLPNTLTTNKTIP